MRFLFSLLLLLLNSVCASAADSPAGRPNFLIILADDLGFSDLGCYGGEIATPNLDALAADGLRFTDFHNTGRCWPSRGSLLTGYYAQSIRRDAIPGMGGGGKGVRPVWARLVPDFLRPAGYRSYHSGKWHVDGLPLEGGFDHSYLLQDQGRYFSPRVHYEDDVKLPPVSPATGYYGTVAIADHCVRTLRDHAAHYPGKPFFHYLAFTAPHFPLQALPEDIERYRSAYLRGWDILRGERYDRQIKLGLLEAPLSAVERTIGPPYPFPAAIKAFGPGEVDLPLPWDGLTEAQKSFQATKMAIHAAMVDRMDQEIGRVLGQLKVMGAYENTVIFFASDNGASAEMMIRNDGHDPAAAPGSAATHLCLGPGWSTVCNTPFRRHKTWVHEGGIATPLIVHWPAGISARGELRRDPGHLVDIVPTLLELSSVAKPATWEGRKIPDAPGRSLVPAFAANGKVSHESLWWFHEANRAVRVGDWKLVAAGPNAPWELYHLGQDRSETRDLAATMPDKVRELEAVWKAGLDHSKSLAGQE